MCVCEKAPWQVHWKKMICECTLNLFSGTVRNDLSLRCNVECLWTPSRRVLDLLPVDIRWNGHETFGWIDKKIHITHPLNHIKLFRASSFLFFAISQNGVSGTKQIAIAVVIGTQQQQRAVIRHVVMLPSRKTKENPNITATPAHEVNTPRMLGSQISPTLKRINYVEKRHKSNLLINLRR